MSVSSGTGSPGQSRTKAHKTIVVVVVVVYPVHNQTDVCLPLYVQISKVIKKCNILQMQIITITENVLTVIIVTLTVTVRYLHCAPY